MSESKYDIEGTTMGLLSSDVETRSAAQREALTWPLIMIYEMTLIASHQDSDARTSRSLRVGNVVWRLQSSATVFPLSYDVLIIALSEYERDVRFAWAVMEVLKRYYAYQDRAKQMEVKEGRPLWGSAMIMRRMARAHIEINTNVDATSAASPVGWYNHYEKPLLKSLCRLLPRVDTDTFSVSPTDRNTLLCALRCPYRDVELTLVLLDFLGEVGGAECYAPLECLQHASIDTDNGHKIRAAAQSCLTRIATRGDKKRQAQTLLRAAASPAPSDAHTLLRSLRQSAPDPAPETLLRPAE